MLAYNVFRCWVSEYQALPQLDAGGNAVMISTIKLENEGWVRDTVGGRAQGDLDRGAGDHEDRRACCRAATGTRRACCTASSSWRR